MLKRPRRLRQDEALRQLVRETHLCAEQLVMPLFVREGTNVRAPIPSLPGQFQLSVDQLVKECEALREDGVPAVLLFGLARHKDDRGSGAWAADGLVQQAVRAIKARLPTLLVITDVCLCAYTTYGHCGMIRKRRPQSIVHSPQQKGQNARQRRGALRHSVTLNEQEWWIDNDATLELVAKAAVSLAQAGADLLAPSDMMDGNVGAARQALDARGFDRVPILAYTVKYASALYAPFRQAVDSAPQIGDRRSHQMDPANAEEALREAALDIEQGADILMVKPALAYLDIIRRLKQTFPHPIAAFSVSGEYAMVKAAAARGWIAERPVWMELLLAMKRAGADLIITYWARDAAKLLKSHEFSIFD